MIGFAVLRAGAALVIPIEEDNHTGCRFDIVFCPLATIFEPVDAIYAACVFGNDGTTMGAEIKIAAGRGSGLLFLAAILTLPRAKAGGILGSTAN